MIVVDTNVISESIRPEPAPAVMAWLNAQPASLLYLTTISQAELLFGIARLPAGLKKERLIGAVAGIERLFAGRILSFDSAAAMAYAPLASNARDRGQGFPTPDGYIAAIAAANGFSVATRDVAPFRAAALSVINPWEYDA